MVSKWLWVWFTVQNWGWSRLGFETSMNCFMRSIHLFWLPGCSPCFDEGLGCVRVRHPTWLLFHNELVRPCILHFILFFLDVGDSSSVDKGWMPNKMLEVQFKRLDVKLKKNLGGRGPPEVSGPGFNPEFPSCCSGAFSIQVVKPSKYGGHAAVLPSPSSSPWLSSWGKLLVFEQHNPPNQTAV